MASVLNNPLKVGIPVSLTGQFRAQGHQALAGIKTWVADSSLPVSLVYYDDASRREAVRPPPGG